MCKVISEYILTDKRKASSKIYDKLLRRKNIVTAVKYIYMSTYLVNKINTLKEPRGLTQDSGHGKLVQLVFVSHMQYMIKFYWNISFARPYRLISVSGARRNVRKANWTDRRTHTVIIVHTYGSCKISTPSL